MDFRATFTDFQVRARGVMDFFIDVEYESAPSVWEAVPGMPEQISVPLTIVRDIAQGPGTIVQKRAKLRDHILDMLAVDKAVRAIAWQDQLEDALPDMPLGPIEFTV